MVKKFPAVGADTAEASQAAEIIEHFPSRWAHGTQLTGAQFLNDNFGRQTNA
jgi:hypothetical protein